MKGTITKRGPSSYRVEISTGKRLKNGRYQRIRKSASSTEEAKKILAELNLQLLKGDYKEFKDMTVKQLSVKWLEHVRIYRRPKTYEFYESIFRYYIEEEVGHLSALKVKPLTIQTLLNKWSNEGKSKTTVRHIKSTVSAMFGWAVGLDMLETNPVGKTTVSEVDSGVTAEEVWSFEQIMKVLKNADDEPYGIYFWIALMTGMRQNEILALRWDNVDLKTGSVSVVEAVKWNKGGELIIGPPKTKSSKRLVSIPETLIALLWKNKVKQSEQKLKKGPAYDDKGLVVANQFGNVVNSGHLRKVCARVAEKAGVPYIPPRNFRHSHVIWSLGSGVDPKSMQERLGHERFRTMQDNYSLSLPNTQRDVALTLENELHKMSKEDIRKLNK